MMNYKLLVLDVDGTLLNGDLQCSKRTIATMRKVQQMGVKIMLASGRPTYGLLHLAKALDLGANGGYVMSYNGGQVINAADGTILYERRINPEMLPFLERKAQQYGCAVMTYDGDTVVSNNIEDEQVQAEARLNGMKLRYLPDFSTAIDFMPCEVVLCTSDHEAAANLDDKWTRRLSGECRILRPRDGFLEVLGDGVDKSSAMTVIMEQLGIQHDEVLAIGDGVADVTMLQSAGLGIAMGGAPESVKRCADQTTLTVEEDGAAVAVEKIILEEVRQSEQIPIDLLNAQSASTLMGNLGIQYTFASKDRVEATMPVDHRNRQPFGILHGGASLALAETVAGLGSMIACPPDYFTVGQQVSGNHVSSAHEGDTVRAVGTAIHLGRTSHVWNVDIFTATGKLVSTVRVINSVLPRR